MTTEKRKPIHEIRYGSVKAAIWANQSPKTGAWHSVTISRLYKQGENWKRSESFGAAELPLVIQVVETAAQWMQAMAKGPTAATESVPSANPPLNGVPPNTPAA